MYVLGTEQCSLPNSETPISQSAIDQETAFGNSVGTAFDNGNSTLNNLIQALGGNPAGDTLSGAAGVPTTGTLDTDTAGIPVVPASSSAPASATLPNVNNPNYWAWAPSPASPRIVRGGGAGYRAPQGEQRSMGQRRKFTNAKQQPAPAGPPPNCPIVVPLVTAIPVPAVAPAQAPVQTAPAQITTPAPAAAPANCMTGNYCLDIMNGCILSSQVTPQQLQICSQAGYAGNRNLFPAIAAAGGADNGAFFGTPEPNPPPYTPGMSGFGQDDTSAIQEANSNIFGSVLESLITAAATAGALAILWKQRKSKG